MKGQTMNQVDCKRNKCVTRLDCGYCETISNGSECDSTMRNKALNGVVNGAGVSIVLEDDASIMKTGDDSMHLHSEENDKKLKKVKKKRNKSDIYFETTSQFCLLDDFDIMNIIHSKYDQEGTRNDKLKIVVSQFEKIGIGNDMCTIDSKLSSVANPSIDYVAYQSELQMPLIMRIIQKDLSEPYSIYTYRYFIHNWPNLCFLAMHDDLCVGAIVCKLDLHRKVTRRGYIAMLAVDKQYRKHGLGSTLVKRAIQEMIAGEADEVVLETEITNRPALRLYEALGFVRDKRLFRYYLNGVDALRLKLWLR